MYKFSLNKAVKKKIQAALLRLKKLSAPPQALGTSLAQGRDAVTGCGDRGCETDLLRC